MSTIRSGKNKTLRLRIFVIAYNSLIPAPKTNSTPIVVPSLTWVLLLSMFFSQNCGGSGAPF